MPKKSEDVQRESITAPASAEAETEVKPDRSTPASQPKRKAPRKAKAKKKTASRRESATELEPRSKQPPSEDEIRLRAYFVAERRARLSIPGDTESDWLEAKRQLFEEAGIPFG